MVKMILFDLDGTLLPMDQEVFTKAYFKRLAAKLAPHGYEPEKLIAGIWTGTAAMVNNDGAVSTKKRSGNAFPELLGTGCCGISRYSTNITEWNFRRLPLSVVATRKRKKPLMC